jgi:phosphoglycolate phosphatase
MIILFDLDGTLIDSTEAILESFEIAFKTFNKTPPSNEQIKKLIGLPLDIMFSKLGVEKGKEWDYVTAYKQHYRKISTQKTVLLPFAEESIKKASNIATLGIVTTKTSKYSAELMKHFKLLDYFKVLIGREDVENPKPHPEPILKALAKLNYTKGEKAFMIGDRCFDAISAKKGGIKSIGVENGYGSFNELESCFDFVVQNCLDGIEKIEYIIKKDL